MRREDGSYRAKAERHGLECIVIQAQGVALPGPSRDWRNIKTAGWREANHDRWRLLEASGARGSPQLAVVRLLAAKGRPAIEAITVNRTGVLHYHGHRLATLTLRTRRACPLRPCSRLLDTAITAVRAFDLPIKRSD
jgi:hypothetical protein